MVLKMKLKKKKQSKHGNTNEPTQIATKNEQNSAPAQIWHNDVSNTNELFKHGTQTSRITAHLTLQ